MTSVPGPSDVVAVPGPAGVLETPATTSDTPRPIRRFEFIHFALECGYDVIGTRWDSTHADNLINFEKNLINE